MKILIAIVLMCLLSGCASKTTREYYPPTVDTAIVEEVDGKILSIRGAIKFEETESGFTLGTQGLGNYQILPVSLF